MSYVWIMVAVSVFSVGFLLWFMSRAKQYRSAYDELIDRCADFVGFAKKVAQKVESTESPHKVQQIESLVGSFESLAMSLEKLPRRGLNPQRIELFRIIMRDLTYGFFQLFRVISGEAPGLCYACSRPDVQLYPVEFWWKNALGVYGCCQSCQRLFSLKKRLQVLCFMGKTHPEHWSEFLEYHPRDHFEDLKKGVTPSDLRRCDLIVFCSQK